MLRHVFERVVWAAMAMGLVKGEGFAVDASVLEANASRYHGKAPEQLDWSEQQRQTRAVAEYLAALDETAEPNPDRKVPKVISPSDPSSAWTAKANKRVQFGYGLNYLIDIENAVIVDVEATPARNYDEVAATKIMIDRTERCFALKPKRLAADTAYARVSSSVGSSTPKRSPRTSRSGRRAIERTASSHALTSSGTSGMVIISAPTGSNCAPAARCTTGARCSTAPRNETAMSGALRPRCCTRDEARKIPRDLHEDARDVARRKMKTKAFARSRDERKRVEMRFAHLKTHHGFERLRLRGLSGARDEFHLAAIVQNLKTLALRLVWPPPDLSRPRQLREGRASGVT